MDYSFRTDYSFIFVLVGLILSFVISYYYYRNSKLDSPQKKFFTVLRFLSVFFILLLLLSPVISFIKNLSEDPVNVFFIDLSQSILIDKRNEEIKEIVESKVENINPGNSENLYYLFSGSLYQEINESEFESIDYNGINNFETNLTNSLYSLQQKLAGKNLSTISIISDGIINKGGNPVLVAKALNVPINYILVGDTIQKNDLVLKNTFYNKVVFIESTVPINVEVNSYNYDRDIKINLYEEDKLIGSKNLKVTTPEQSYSLTFDVLSNTEAVIKYKIEIEGLNDEITLRNNFQEFFIKFVDNKFKILVLSGGPSADLGFLSEEIKRIKNFEATFLTQKSATEFYEQALPDLNSFDSFIFIGYPTAITNQSILNDVKDKLERNNSSLIFFASRNVEYQKLTVLEDKLPFKLMGFSQAEEETGIKTVSSLNNEIFKNSDLLSTINSLPNIFKTGSNFSSNPSAETFLLMNRNSEPALIIQNTDKNKSAAFLAYGLYKWRLNNQNNNSGELLNYIITNTLVATTNKEEKKPFVIETTKPVYSRFENVIFEASIRNFELQGGEEIKVKVKGNNFNNEFNLIKTDNRFYRGEINIPVDGNYEYVSELYSKNLLVGSVYNRFAIGENNNEYLLTRADNTILSALSNETKGINLKNLNSSSINDSLKIFNEKSKAEYKSPQNFELNINPYFLFGVILLLCLEWFFRKRNNLP